MKKIFLAVMALSSSLMVFAAIGASNGQRILQPASGFYSSLQTGIAIHNPPSGAALNVGVYGFAGVKLGYLFANHIALEAAFNKFTDKSSDGETTCSGAHCQYVNTPDHDRVWVATLAGKYLFDVTGRHNFYVLGGVAIAHENVFNVTYNLFDPSMREVSIDEKNTAVMPLVGIGYEFYCTPHLALHISAENAFGTGKIANIFMLPIGLAYHF